MEISNNSVELTEIAVSTEVVLKLVLSIEGVPSVVVSAEVAV